MAIAILVKFQFIFAFSIEGVVVIHALYANSYALLNSTVNQFNNKDDGLSLLEWHEATRYHDDGQVDDIKKRLYATIKKFIKWKKSTKILFGAIG